MSSDARQRLAFAFSVAAVWAPAPGSGILPGSSGPDAMIASMGTRRGNTPPADLDDPEQFLRFAAMVAAEVPCVTAVTADAESFSLDIVLGEESMRLNLGHLHAQTDAEGQDRTA